MTEFYLKDINQLNKVRDVKDILELPYVKVSTECRIYYKEIKYEDTPEWKGCGFHFWTIQTISYPGHMSHLEDDVFVPESRIEMLLSGVAYFDGIRHLYFGSEKTDNYGYFNYPAVNLLVKILDALAELEHKYCREWDDD